MAQCKSCDLCSGLFFHIAAFARYLIIVGLTLGLYIVWYHFLISKCDRCGHKMIYHRGQTSYWRKKR